MRKKFFILRVVRHWHSLPREAMAVPSLEALQVKLAGALSNVNWFKVSLLIAGGLELKDL